MMITFNFPMSQKEGVQGEGKKKRGGTLKKGRSDARCGRSHRASLVRGVGCEEQEKTWTVVCGSTPQEGQRGLRINPPSCNHWRLNFITLNKCFNKKYMLSQPTCLF